MSDLTLGQRLNVRLKRVVRWREILHEGDYSFCAYYRGEGTCSMSCRSEPACQTDMPIDGWPSERAWRTTHIYDLGTAPRSPYRRFQDAKEGLWDDLFTVLKYRWLDFTSRATRGRW